ncbi:hypothetical protein [Streptomyces sp. NPDC013181]|uniref:hypothetical protein n=1 Tax=Streptomyces sp. NPDC013181 TaxID=3364864 RepID=UPI00369792A5
MTEGDWYDDSAYDDAVQRAKRATRFGWLTIGATVAVFFAVLCGVAVVIALAAYAYIETRG